MKAEITVNVGAKRAAAYPSIADQLDAIWKGGEEMEIMRARILQVKQLHPKASPKENSDDGSTTNSN